MKLRHFAAAGLALGLATAGHTSTIGVTFEAFDPTNWSSAVGSGVFEDFENATDANRQFEGVPRDEGGNLFGELDDNGFRSDTVGHFTTLGGIGGGSTCTDNLNLSGSNCDQIALQFDPGLNGQGNVLPDDGFWSLNSADTFGIGWTAERGDGGMFQRIVFALTDPADTGGQSLDISLSLDGTNFESLVQENSLPDGAEWLVVLDLPAPTDLAYIEIRTEQGNPGFDGFTIDGTALAPIPLPASALLLLGGVGALVAMRRRRS